MQRVVLVSLLSSAVAFVAPQANVVVAKKTALKAEAVTTEEVLATLPGVSTEIPGKGAWDPLGLAQWRSPYQLRACELKNGRVAMLACVGWVWPQVVGTFPTDVVKTTDPVECLTAVPFVVWAQIVVLCGVMEAAEYNWARGILAEPFGFDPTKIFFDPAKVYPADAKGQEEMQLKELKNGRMAMIAFAGLVTHHFMPDAVPLLGDLK